MSLIFVAFGFIKTTSGNVKFTTGTALYHATDEEDDFREFTYKGFTGSTDSLIIEFEKNLIVLMIGRYVYHDNAEFVSFSTLPICTFPLSLIDLTSRLQLGLIQPIPATSTSNSTCSPEDLLNAFPLLLYTAPAVTNSHKCNDNIGRQSFMLSKKLYNPVNGQKGIDSNVLVFYANANGQYDSLKDSLKKSVVSAIGRLKLGPGSKFPHIISSEIEWSYASIEPKSSPQSATDKINFTKQFNDQLDMIEEQYATVTSHDSNKRRRTGLFTSSHKNSNNNPLTVDFPDLVNQIRTNIPEPQPPQESTTNKLKPRPPQESTTDKPEPQQTSK
ncbi:hypothetical protein C2G38_2030215 [Gigaspora rosea]|uniref:Uncharacterized protein n=1 Tax=Gigaspora rosea TaxID=44941 RepID=A0A397VV12_9GLOM|nr:hypothetical protein C2G38_2030215 [Gigaspora rosea]